VVRTSLGVTTDEMGNLEIQNISDRDINKIEFSFIDYEKQIITFTVQDTSNQTAEIWLESSTEVQDFL